MRLLWPSSTALQRAMPNPCIERTSSGKLRLPTAAAHVNVSDGPLSGRPPATSSGGLGSLAAICVTERGGRKQPFATPEAFAAGLPLAAKSPANPGARPAKVASLGGLAALQDRSRVDAPASWAQWSPAGAERAGVPFPRPSCGPTGRMRR